MFANSVLRSRENVGPVNSESSGCSLRAKKNTSPLSVEPTRWLGALAVFGDHHAAVRRDGDVVRPVGIAVLVARRVREVQLELDRLVARVDEPHLAVVLVGTAVARAREG